MSIFLNTVMEGASYFNDYDVPVYEGYINPEAEGLMAIATECVQDGHDTQYAVMMAASVNNSIALENADPSLAVLTESTKGSIFQRMKETWLKFWSKIKAWFKNMIDSTKAFFMSGEEFVKKYRSELAKVDVKGFKYNGHKWDVDKGIGQGEQFIGKARASITKAEKDFPSNGEKGVEKSKTEYIEDVVYKDLGEDSLADIKKSISDAFRGGEKEEIEDMSHVSAMEMIMYVADAHKKTMKDLDKGRKEVEKNVKDQLKILERAQKDVSNNIGKEGNDDDKSRNIISNITMLDGIVRDVQSIIIGVMSTFTTELKAMASEYVSVLRRLRTYKQKSVNESYGGGDDLFSAIMESVKQN